MTAEYPPNANDVAIAFTVLSDFLGTANLTTQLAQAESELVQTTADDAGAVAAQHGFTQELLDATLLVRSKVGRLNDVVHATTIALALPHILEPDERVVNRPSLGAGNDPTRPYDLETDRRIAEFKVAQWKGADTMRKRGVVADLVHLSLDDSGRRAQLYIVGELPNRFLVSSTSTVAWMLGRSSVRLRQRFADKYGEDSTMTVAEFRAGPAAHIDIIDLRGLVSGLE